MHTRTLSWIVGDMGIPQPALHADAFRAASVGHPELFTWMSMGPFTTSADFSTWV